VGDVHVRDKAATYLMSNEPKQCILKNKNHYRYCPGE